MCVTEYFAQHIGKHLFVVKKLHKCYQQTGIQIILNIREVYMQALATKSRGYTGETHLRGLKTYDFLLVHGDGL
ncbi:hypothetical protein [Nostoc sp. JL33]|uniref:hypothetical protein n=1 Tax=Nostoc sp. JL33 TaxID=2815396 RepID=UPI0025E2BF46|nr:hypothetical protein [Nostoc sp. JL33]